MTQHLARGLEVVRVTSESEFRGLEQVWNDLAREAASPSVFLQHEWFAAAWAWRRGDARLQTLLARRGDRIVGVLPLIRLAGPPRRVVEYELLTIPDTQVVDMLCAPANVEEVADAFAVALTKDTQWDILRLDSLPPSGPCMTLLMPQLRRHHLQVAQRDGGRNSFIDLSSTWDQYYGSRTRRLKKAMNLAANRLHREGEVEIEWIGPDRANEARWQAALDESIRISAQSWKRHTGNALDQPGPQAFIRALSRSAFERKWLAIWLLRLRGKPVAMEYALMFERSVHALRADFDAECVKTSPGAHLFRHLLQHLFDAGLTRYYMGRGENAYKMRWSDDADPLSQIVAYNRTPNGRLEWLREEVLKPALRRTRDAVWTNVSAPSQRELHEPSDGRGRG